MVTHTHTHIHTLTHTQTCVSSAETTPTTHASYHLLCSASPLALLPTTLSGYLLVYWPGSVVTMWLCFNPMLCCVDGASATSVNQLGLDFPSSAQFMFCYPAREEHSAARHDKHTIQIDTQKDIWIENTQITEYSSCVTRGKWWQC